MMVYPDVGQYKMQQLKSLERIHAKLNKSFDPNYYAPMSRKDLQSVLHDLSLELSTAQKKTKRSGVIVA